MSSALAQISPPQAHLLSAPLYDLVHIVDDLRDDDMNLEDEEGGGGKEARDAAVSPAISPTRRVHANSLSSESSTATSMSSSTVNGFVQSSNGTVSSSQLRTRSGSQTLTDLREAGVEIVSCSPMMDDSRASKISRDKGKRKSSSPTSITSAVSRKRPTPSSRAHSASALTPLMTLSSINSPATSFSLLSFPIQPINLSESPSSTFAPSSLPNYPNMASGRMSPSSYTALQRGMWEHNSPPPSMDSKTVLPPVSTNFKFRSDYEALASVIGLDLSAPLSGELSSSTRSPSLVGGEVESRTDVQMGEPGPNSWTSAVTSIRGSSSSFEASNPTDPPAFYPSSSSHFGHDRHISTSSAPGTYHSTTASQPHPLGAATSSTPLVSLSSISNCSSLDIPPPNRRQISDGPFVLPSPSAIIAGEPPKSTERPIAPVRASSSAAIPKAKGARERAESSASLPPGPTVIPASGKVPGIGTKTVKYNQPVKAFRCADCPQSFSRNHDLKRHQKIHLAVKPFACTNCTKAFTRKDALRRHLTVKLECGKVVEMPQSAAKIRRERLAFAGADAKGKKGKGKAAAATSEDDVDEEDDEGDEDGDASGDQDEGDEEANDESDQDGSNRSRTPDRYQEELPEDLSPSRTFQPIPSLPLGLMSLPPPLHLAPLSHQLSPHDAPQLRPYHEAPPPHSYYQEPHHLPPPPAPHHPYGHSSSPTSNYYPYNPHPPMPSYHSQPQYYSAHPAEDPHPILPPIGHFPSPYTSSEQWIPQPPMHEQTYAAYPSASLEEGAREVGGGHDVGWHGGAGQEARWEDHHYHGRHHQGEEQHVPPPIGWTQNQQRLHEQRHDLLRQHQHEQRYMVEGDAMQEGQEGSSSEEEESSSGEEEEEEDHILGEQ